MTVLAESKSVEIPDIHDIHTHSSQYAMNEHLDVSEQQKKTSTPTLPWRPVFHLTAPHGWLNDPCGLGYDPATGLYHLAFQWNPCGNDWGNVSWGHSVSSDLVTWKTSPHPCLTPSAQYDRCGVFTGCLRPTGVHGNPGALTYIYTSIGHLPIHYTLPYVAGSESLSVATSHDGGNTWERSDSNPILPGPPPNVNVTGWRDPYLSAWPAMRSNPDASSDLYGFISGGIAAESPTVFAYSVNPKDLREWKYIGSLVNVGLNFKPSRWSGDFGVNWEVATMATLIDGEGASRDFVIMGAEGCIGTGHQPKRDPRGQRWMSVKLRSEQDNTSDSLATYAFAGIFDHGCLYAANSFFDSVMGWHIVYGWIMEEDLPDSLRYRQGWSGLISLPRAVKLTTLHHVERARHSELKSITSIEMEENTESGTHTIRTLGIQPDPRLEKLRMGAHKQLADLELNPESFELPLTTSRWELDAEFAVGKQCTGVSVAIDHGGKHCRFPFSSLNINLFPGTNHTILSWDPLNEKFTIKRPNPDDSGINHYPELAPHTLFTFSDPATGKEKEETLRIRAYFDMSVLEVFVNERTVISTRVYSSTGRCARILFFAESDKVEPGASTPVAVLLHADVWDELTVIR